MRLIWLPVERKDIEHQSADGREYITEAIARLAHLWITEGRPSRAELTISGYDDDPRELYEIPEVCQWANWIVHELPVLPFFLTDTALDRFAGWLCGPVSRKVVTSNEFSRKYTSVRMKCVTKAYVESAEFLMRIGADQPTVSKFYFQIIADRARQQPETK